MGTPETHRGPCPNRFIDETGMAFGIGIIGGSAYHFFKGVYNSPSGARLTGGSTASSISAPRVGGTFAAWAAAFSVFDCAMVYVRKKEDPWNSLIAGAASGGFLKMRQGVRASAKSAATCGALVALCEGGMIMGNKLIGQLHGLQQERQQLMNPVVIEEKAANVGASGGGGDEGSSGGWFRWFGKSKEAAAGGSEMTMILDGGFDKPPVPGFEYK